MPAHDSKALNARKHILSVALTVRHEAGEQLDSPDDTENGVRGWTTGLGAAGEDVTLEDRP